MLKITSRFEGRTFSIRMEEPSVKLSVKFAQSAFLGHKCEDWHIHVATVTHVPHATG